MPAPEVSKHQRLAINRRRALTVVQSNVEMADSILHVIQQHFSQPHPDTKHCDCADRLRAARMLLREAIRLAGRGDGR